MPRRVRVTVLERGASPTAWVESRGLGADDWLVVAQQGDEPASAFSERVQRRALRLGKNASIESIDVYSARQASDEKSTTARRSAIEVLSAQLVQGGHLTLWSPSADEQTDQELAAILTLFAPILAKRQVAMSHQSCEREAPSGLRHTPVGAAPSPGDDFSLDDFGLR